MAGGFVLKGGLLVVNDSYSLILVILVIVNIRAESLVEVLVHDLSLTISLRVVHYREL